MKFTLKEKKEEVPGVVSFIWDPEAPITWQPGQYFHYVLKHDGADERGEERWFTNSAAPFMGRAMITTRFAGEEGSSFKKALFAMEPGGTIEVDGPEGDFTIEDASKDYVLIAGGIGITPFHAMVAQAGHDNAALHATLIYGNRDERVPFRAELDAYAAKNPSFKITYLMGTPIDEAVIKACVPDITKPLFYISGPEPMVKALSEKLAAMGVPGEHIKLDDFPGYGPQY